MEKYYKHPLSTRLAEDDVLFFLHIPKTGGLSMISYLDNQFEPAQICPLHSDPSHTLFPELPLENRMQYRLVHGHFRFGPYDEGIYKYICPNPVRMTVLRKPMERTISAYRYSIRKEHIPADMSLEGFMDDPNFPNRARNVQARLIVGAVRGNFSGTDYSFKLSDDALYVMAKQNLEEFAFVGLTEKFEESMELLAYTFGWRMPRNIPHENSAPDPFDLNTLEPRVVEKLRAAVSVDQALYDYAEQLFNHRRSQMAHELFEEAQTYGVSVHLPKPNLPSHKIQQKTDAVKQWLGRTRRVFISENTRGEKVYLFVRNTVLRQSRKK